MGWLPLALNYRFFEGNPLAVISSIDVSGGIACSRTSGQTPCFVQVSASEILATGTDVPYEDLDYYWDFGDPTGVEIFTNPVTAQPIIRSGSVNANNSQTGPREAAYCYRSAGTYTVTLTVRGKNSLGAFIEASTQQDITVSAWSGTDYYFDSVGGLDVNDGLSSGQPKQTLSAINAAISSNVRINLKRGSVWTGATALLQVVDASSGIRIQAYGSGALPAFNVVSGDDAASAFKMKNGGASSPSSKSDIVISNTAFSSDADTVSAACIEIAAVSNDTATLEHIYFDGCTMSHLAPSESNNVEIQGNEDLLNFAGFWNCVLTGIDLPDQGQRMTIYSVVRTWWFVVGCSLSGGGSNLTLDHHIYPNTQQHALYRWINFGYGTGKNFCINNNYENHLGGGVEYAEFILIADCRLSGTLRAWDASNGNNDASESLFRNFVVQNCSVNGLTGGSSVIFYCCESMTVRDIFVWDCEPPFFRPDVDGLADILTMRIYRNKLYNAAIAGNSAQLNFATATLTHPFEINYNTFHDARATALMIDLNFADSHIVDRNQYYAPSDSNSKFLRDGVTDKSFAEWQAASLDVHGTVTNPAWLDPANGDFRT